jgi:hypothetical protein
MSGDAVSAAHTSLPGRFLVIAVPLVLSACAGGSVVTSTHAIGTVEGRLEAGTVEWQDMSVDCVWLVDAAGRKFDLMGLPDGWTQRTDPIRIFDRSGREIAREGAILRITFNADAIGETLCAPGKPLVAETVVGLASNIPISSLEALPRSEGPSGG